MRKLNYFEQPNVNLSRNQFWCFCEWKFSHLFICIKFQSIICGFVFLISLKNCSLLLWMQWIIGFNIFIFIPKMYLVVYLFKIVVRSIDWPISKTNEKKSKSYTGYPVLFNTQTMLCDAENRAKKSGKIGRRATDKLIFRANGQC